MAEARRRLSDPASRHLTVEAIAAEVGFNSRASFYRVFKKATGRTPGDFLAALDGGATATGEET